MITSLFFAGYFDQFSITSLLSTYYISYVINNYVVYLTIILLSIYYLLYATTSLFSKFSLYNTLQLFLYKLGFSVSDSLQSSLRFLVFSYMLNILLFNLTGLLPYSLTITALSFYSLFLSIVLWFTKTGVVLDRYGILSFLSRFYVSSLGILVASFLFIIELLSYCIPAVSLGLRLYVNLMSSHVLSKVFVGFALLVYKPYSLICILVSFVPLSVLGSLNLLEVGVGLVQAYVYAVLSSLYLGDVTSSPILH